MAGTARTVVHSSSRSSASLASSGRARGWGEAVDDETGESLFAAEMEETDELVSEAAEEEEDEAGEEDEEGDEDEEEEDEDEDEEEDAEVEEEEDDEEGDEDEEEEDVEVEDEEEEEEEEEEEDAIESSDAEGDDAADEEDEPVDEDGTAIAVDEADEELDDDEEFEEDEEEEEDAEEYEDEEEEEYEEGDEEDEEFDDELAGAGAAVARAGGRPLIALDAGWLFLTAGLMLVAATVVIPAQHDLAVVRWQRDRAVAIESHRLERLSRYGSYLDALRRGDESVVLSLAASQLNKTSIDRVPLYQPADPAKTSASVFPALEPEKIRLPEPPRQASMLGRLTASSTARLWMMAGGLLCIFAGLLPTGRGGE